MKATSLLLSIFKEQHGYARSKDILTAGYRHETLTELVEQGIIIKIKHGLYRLASISLSDELEEVSRIVPEGVVCLFSAWNYYELSDFIPPEYHLAIEKSQKLVLPAYPPIQLYYWSQKYWETGKTTVVIGEKKVQMYALEKSVCDVVRFRNKVGKEIEKEVLTNYLRRPDRNIEELLRFARLLRIEKLLKEYLNLLL